MDPIRWFREHAAAGAAAGATLVLVQNVLLLAGLGLALGARSPAGGAAIRVGFSLDLLGIGILGASLLGLARRGAGADRADALLARSGALCLAWVLLTVAWRVAGLAALGGEVERYAGDPDSAVAAFAAFLALLLATWIAASACLAGAAVLFALSGRARGRPPPIAWPLFAVLNLAGTGFLAGTALGFAGGTVDVPLFASALYAKVVAIPAVGVFGYAALARTFLRLRGESEAPAAAPAEPAASDPPAGP